MGNINNGGFMYKPVGIQGWMYNCELNFLYDNVKKLEEGSNIIEIGCWKGKSSHAIAKGIRDSNKKINLTCIDTFKGAESDPDQQQRAIKENPLKEFKKNMENFEVNILAMDSKKACYKFEDESIDFLFLDTDHNYEHTITELKLWWPKIKQGGILCGHDYKEGYRGVKRAVDEFFTKNKIHLFPKSIFLVKKEK